MNSPIVVDDLVKTFEQKNAVDHVSFEVREGEFLVFVGPSGCGKTTTLRLIAGLEAATSGEIRMDGRVVNEIRPRDRNVAMVFQDYAVFPHLTVYENIAYGLRSRGAPGAVIKERVPKAAKTFRIDHLLKRKPRQLSGGERQRVALARAMVRDANLYLYDEPLSNLDAQLRHEAREDILALHQTHKKPSLYVTHDQSEALALGDRIAIMRAGKIEQIGSGSELYEKPRNKFVAFFLGTPSINLFEARLQSSGDALEAITDAFTLRLPDWMRPRIGKHAGSSITLGIRPEDLHIPKQASLAVDEGNTVHGVVNVIEPSAAGSSVYLSTTSGQDFVATFKIRIPASYLGREIPLAINGDRVQLFDQTSELSLLHVD
jgi:multiple sugar transport system ATP-binding protein